MTKNAVNNVVDLNDTAKSAEILAFEKARSVFYLEMAELGNVDRLGKQSPYKASIKFQDAVREGFIKATSDEARKAYQAYDGSEQPDVLGVDKVSNTLASQTANLLTFGLPVSVSLGDTIYQQVDRVIRGYATTDLYGSKIKCYIKANRELHKIYEAHFKTSGDNVASIQAACEASGDSLVASWLIKEGAKKVNEGGEETDGEDKKTKAKSTPLEKLALLQKALAKLVKDDFAGNADLERTSKQLNAAYFTIAAAANK
jgi:hypothetical protein